MDSRPRRRLLKQVRDSARVAGLAKDFLLGYRSFLRSGVTPRKAYRAMRKLHVFTDGAWNRWVMKWISRSHPPRLSSTTKGVLGEVSRSSVAATAERIRSDGYCVLETRLPEPQCAALESYARNTLASPLDPLADTEGYDEPGGYLEPSRFSETEPRGSQYWFSKQQVFTHPDVQALLMDPTILGVAREYLHCEPIIGNTTMWWSIASGDQGPSSKGAQLFHYDMDQIRFLKVFIYVLGVTPETGPHVFVRGSHSHKHEALRRDGRILDDEIRDVVSDRDIVEICGPRGTIFFADTSGFHKGKVPVDGPRLVLQLGLVASLFGQDYPRVEIGLPIESKFHRFIQENERLFAHFDVAAQ